MEEQKKPHNFEENEEEKSECRLPLAHVISITSSERGSISENQYLTEKASLQKDDRTKNKFNEKGEDA